MAAHNLSPRFSEVARLIHEPARLAILSVLSACRAADFLYLQNATGLTKGNLSVQLSKLEEAGLIRISKEIIGKKTRTTAHLATKGDREIAEYWNQMEKFRRASTSITGD